jgi:hypothetical protein
VSAWISGLNAPLLPARRRLQHAPAGALEGLHTRPAHARRGWPGPCGGRRVDERTAWCWASTSPSGFVDISCRALSSSSSLASAALCCLRLQFCKLRLCITFLKLELVYKLCCAADIKRGYLSLKQTTTGATACFNACCSVSPLHGLSMRLSTPPVHPGTLNGRAALSQSADCCSSRGTDALQLRRRPSSVSECIPALIRTCRPELRGLKYATLPFRRGPRGRVVRVADK